MGKSFKGGQPIMNSENAKRKINSEEAVSINLLDEESSGKYNFIGEVFDTIYHPDGSIEKREKSFNIVVDSISRLISALIKNQSGYSSGNLYWAVGQGAGSWDDAPYSPVSSNKTLQNEVFRKAIPASNRSFIDNNGNKTSSVTNRLQLDIAIESGEANGYSLREFGIFGGNASGTRNSGIMINHKSHSRVDKIEGMRIERSVRFTF